MASEARPSGWALRKNGSCLAVVEKDCGETVAPFRVCCPNGYSCPHAYNVACCPPENDCDAALAAKPVCANSTWDLYFNDGYFCCEQGTTGFAKEGGSDGCGIPGYQLQSGEQKLPIIVSASALSSTTRTPTSTSTSHPSGIATSSAQPTGESSRTNTGAIAGGVVGGVVGAAIIAGLLWFLIRRSRRQQSLESQPEPMPVRQPWQHHQAQSELDSNRVVELESIQSSKPPVELQ